MNPENLKAYKFRLYPTKSQEQMLTDTFGCVRWLWNQRVARFLDWTPETGAVKEPTIKELKVDHEWLGNVPQNALEQKDRDFFQTKKQYFSKTRKTKIGKPKFKKRGNHQSLRLSTNGFRIKNSNEIHAAKMGKLKLKGHSLDSINLDSCKSITISKNPSGQYFVSILVRERIALKERTGKAIGIDMGLSDLFILSNGISISNPRWFRENQAELAKAQKHLSRKEKGSKRYEKQRLKVAKIQQKTANQRSWFLHNTSKLIVDSYDEIVVEDLAVSNLAKNSKLAKSVMDAGWTSFMYMLEYKSKWYGRTFHKIDRWYPSSQICSSCGHNDGKKELSVREWECSSCGTHHNRDLNASLNIAHKGLLDLYGIKSEECSDYIRGDFVRPIGSLPTQLAESMKRIDLC